MWGKSHPVNVVVSFNSPSALRAMAIAFFSPSVLLLVFAEFQIKVHHALSAALYSGSLYPIVLIFTKSEFTRNTM